MRFADEAITFDDVLIVPNFSTVNSRKDVDLSFENPYFYKIGLPVISANMDTITGKEMGHAMLSYGAQACLHRFCSIEDNVAMFAPFLLNSSSPHLPWISIGLGKYELERAETLLHVKARTVVIDVAHGASMSVVNQVKELRNISKECSIVVGNFASITSTNDFLSHVGNLINGIKVGIGPSGVCTTRMKTGVGYPQFSAIAEIAQLKNENLIIVADGGMRTSGDIAKALGAGADLCMIGGMLAGTEETPGEKIWKDRGKYMREHEVFPVKMNSDGSTFLDKNCEINLPVFKVYRGSASNESYEDQNKSSDWRTAEGILTYISYKGPVKNVLDDINGGLRSSFSYVGAFNLKDFQEKVRFVKVTNATRVENTAYKEIK